MKLDIGQRAPLVTCRYLALAMILIFPLYSPAFAADPVQGGKLYTRHCATCHGAGGHSQMPGAPDFSRGESLLQADMNIQKVIKTGKGMMPGYQGILKDSEILDVISFLRTLR